MYSVRSTTYNSSSSSRCEESWRGAWRTSWNGNPIYEEKNDQRDFARENAARRNTYMHICEHTRSSEHGIEKTCYD